jgi:hypothetical protein
MSAAGLEVRHFIVWVAFLHHCLQRFVCHLSLGLADSEADGHQLWLGWQCGRAVLDTIGGASVGWEGGCCWCLVGVRQG